MQQPLQEQPQLGNPCTQEPSHTSAYYLYKLYAGRGDVDNAVKYMDKEEKFIAIRLYDEDDFVHVEIEDNGKGIANDEIQYIFERFYRTDSSRNSKQGGSGIGLAISKKIMEAHGGRIWATSKLGSGTTIHFILRKIV